MPCRKNPPPPGTVLIKEREARAVYLSMGPGRSLSKMLEHFGIRAVKMRSAEIWSSRFEWVRLANEYDESIAVEVDKKLLKQQTKAAFSVLAESARTTAVDDNWVIERLRQVVERCMEAEPAVDKSGESLGTYTFNAAGANKALELLGRHRGLFIDRREVGAPGDFDRLSDDELDRYIADKAGSLGASASATGKAEAFVEASVRRKPH